MDVLSILTPTPSAYTESARFLLEGPNAELRFVYEHAGSMYSGGLTFSQVRASSFVAEAHASTWHLKAGYGALAEIKNSRWVAALRASQPGYSEQWVPRHFLIYLESIGAFEVAATGAELLPSAAIPWE